MKVIVITGMPGSGKSTAVEHAEANGFPVHRMGQFIWEEVEARGLKVTQDLVKEVATEMRRTHGPDIWAIRTIEKIRRDPAAPVIIIDGCRSGAEVETFRKEFGPDMMVLAISASDEKRFERMRNRNRKDDIKTLGDFEERDRRELGWGLGEVISSAERVIENEGGKEAIQAEFDRLLKELI